jgi:Mg2+ and Co2+ transporter CorA
MHLPVICGTIQQWIGDDDVSQTITFEHSLTAIKDVCMGYNTLHVVSSDDNNNDEFHEDLPRCKRIWNWLILCDDKTVITISEDPFPFRSSTLSRNESRNLGIIRRNLINVFRQCSKARDPLAEITPLVLPLRIRVGDYEVEEQYRSSDVPGLLFYYIFDDWLSIYSLIARSDNRWALELDDLRIRMLSKAELQHVDRLHHLGRQLAVLKRVYHSYDLLIDRLLGKREVTLGMLQNSHVVWSGMESVDSERPLTNMAMHESTLSVGISLTSAAKVRFERLKHRIQLFAMNEVNECVDQKESLVMMNYNLLAIKEALTVERLTEVTLLLAKVTILFMPVSLVTAYFSCQFYDYQFSYKAYWKWFGGIFAISVLALTLFTLLSGTKEGHIITKPLSRRVLDFSGRHILRRKRTKGSDF